MIIGIPKENYPGERRVALVPSVVPTLTKAGFEVHLQSGAGIEAGYPDSQYADKGAKVVPNRAAVFATADIIAQILCYGSNDVTGKQDVPLYRPGQILVGILLRPFGSLEVLQEIARAGVTAFAVECDAVRPRGFQSMDALSSIGDGLRIQGCFDGSRSSSPLFPHAYYCGGNYHAGPRVCHWLRRRKLGCRRSPRRGVWVR